MVSPPPFRFSFFLFFSEKLSNRNLPDEMQELVCTDLIYLLFCRSSTVVFSFLLLSLTQSAPLDTSQPSPAQPSQAGEFRWKCKEKVV